MVAKAFSKKASKNFYLKFKVPKNISISKVLKSYYIIFLFLIKDWFWHAKSFLAKKLAKTRV